MTPHSDATVAPTHIDLGRGDVQVLHGDAREALAAVPDASVDAVVTDPPYGLSKEPDPVEVLTHWLAGDDYVHTGNGFMGTTWDSFVPGPVVWREVYRALKPGGHALVFASPRTVDLMTVALRLAGFQILDSIHWTYAQGWPKTTHVLKPSHEPVVVARKPFRGTLAANLAAHGTGGMNTTACTTPVAAPDGESEDQAGSSGRWPTNTLLGHGPQCRETVPHANACLATWECAEGCPVKEMDAQSGVLTSGKPGRYRGTPNNSAAYGAESRPAGQAMTGFGDSGGASRFFPRFKYAKKATSQDRVTVWVPAPACRPDPRTGEQRCGVDPTAPGTRWDHASSPTPTACACGADWVEYRHPTVKPVDLMEWLLRLVVPDGGTVLDPFAGTGTTGTAAVSAGYRAVLVERDPRHVGMIHKRLSTDVQTSLFPAA